MADVADLLGRCAFPPPASAVDLAVSGGADSVGLALLARAAGLVATIHHVDHRLRPTSSADAELVVALGARLGWTVEVHVVDVAPGGNLEERARVARRAVLPDGCLTGHTMDDLAETVLINLMRGSGVDGLSPMVGDPTKPLLGLRRAEVADLVVSSGERFVRDETNNDPAYVRNRVRHEVLGLLDDVAQRDLVPILARQAGLLADERTWLDLDVATDVARGLDGVDCRELRTWPVARARRWLRAVLREPGGRPPTAAEVDRVLEVVAGRAVATEISGARRVARRNRRLILDGGETTTLRP